MRTPDVSVVVPAHQAAWCLDEALASVADQTFGNFELIVVDDGSTDGTAGVAEEAFARHGLEQARVVARPKQKARFSNAGTARNAGAAVGQGQLLAFLDADDAWYPAKLETVVRSFDEGDADLVCVAHDELIVRDGRKVGRYRAGTKLPLFWRLLLYDNCLSPSGTVVRRDAFEAAGGFSEDPRHHSVEDYDLWLRLSRLGSFQFVHEPLGEYRLWPGTLSGDSDLQVTSKLNVIDDNFDLALGPSRRGWRGLLRRQRRMRAIRDVAWSCRSDGRMGDAARHVRRALAEWPLDPKLWAVWAVITVEKRRRT